MWMISVSSSIRCEAKTISKNVNVLNLFLFLVLKGCILYRALCVVILQSLPYKAVMGCVPLYALFRVMQKMFQELPGLIQNSVGASCLPFACASNSLNKPTPLNLDLSIPSLSDIKWSTARFLYLFNIQLEKNIGTYVLNPNMIPSDYYCYCHCVWDVISINFYFSL